ncbi:hypothetical protein ACCI51_15450 [Microbulbifer echini]|uniref:Uncharacterized protein n=1 Tax=Microbulbifer echini TaxID=1529067 RepID=A0ABV4NSH1_9GAMM
MKKIPPETGGKLRSYVARNPLLGKGGAHVKAKSGVRFAGKQKMLKEVRECRRSRDIPPLAIEHVSLALPFFTCH